MQKAGHRVWHSSTSSRRAAVIASVVACAGAASAMVATLMPAAVIPMVLVLGLVMLAISMSGSAGCDREARLAESDLMTIVQALDQVASGVFDLGETRSHTPSAARIHCALREMTRQVGTRVEMLQDATQSDALTGMANRAHFERMVERELDLRAPDTLCALMFIDIDGFKDVNDTLGHNLGDRLLQCIAERLKMAIRLDQLPPPPLSAVRIARFGGDEFVVFLSGFDTENFARNVANRVLRVLAEPFELSTHVSGISASVGLALVPGGGATFAELLRAADAAMYHAKRSGGNCVERYTPELDAEVQRQAGLERDLRQALLRGEFELHYQPQYDCRTLEISSAEALIRWRHPKRGMVSPAEFIPLAEKSNLICDIGEWVVREAVGTISRLEQLGMPLRISVNVSPQQLEQTEFVSLVKAALARSGANPRLLEVEITESCAMLDCKTAAERLGRLADMGVSVAIDDFGTGYSNLASLIRLPVSRLKIDRSLLQDLTSRSEVRTLAQTIISMASGLGFHSVAEGIEDAEQLKLLCDMGCDVAQGFFLSRPIEQAALEQLLHRDAVYPRVSAIAR
jgi:diguanylate cyclase (GGDEF)-like protein